MSENASAKDYVVRLANTQEDYDFIAKLSLDEGWSCIGLHSVAQMAPLVTPGFYIGILNGERIGQVSVVRYGDEKNEFYFGGFYIVDKRFRGKGYGWKICEYAFAAHVDPDTPNLALDGLQVMVPHYEKPPLNVRKEWLTKEYTLFCANVIEKLSQVLTTKEAVEIKPLQDVGFEKLFEYDRSVFGFPRRDFLKKWITIPESLGWAAINDEGNVVGYALIQRSVRENYQVIGPLFSDDIQVTRALLYSAAEGALKQRSSEHLLVWIPIGFNSSAVDLVEKEIGYKAQSMEAVRMYRKGIPSSVCMEKMIGITSPAFG